MKLISWNVNGLRACKGKGFDEYFESEAADVFCLQETKLQPEQAPPAPDGYHSYFNCAAKKGYSGTAAFSRLSPLSVSYGIGVPEHADEGRAITLEFEPFYLVTVYTPNAQKELARLPYRMDWDDAFRSYVTKLDSKKPVVICGDMNVAHQEIDLKNPGPNHGSAGFSDEERAKFTQLLETGFVDTFRRLYPGRKGAYTWWSYLFHAREHNAGWRIDYFLVSERLAPLVEDSFIRDDVYGSDHCPVGLIIKV